MRAGGPRPLPSPFGVIIMTETCTCRVHEVSPYNSTHRSDCFTIEEVLLIINHMRDIQKYCYDCDLPLPLPTLETGVAGKGGDY